MRKLTILKTIIDFLWILSLMTLPFIILLIGITLFNNSLIGKYNLRIYGLHIEEFTSTTKSLLILPMIAYMLVIYCIYLFRNVIKKFNELNVFNSSVIQNMNKIGITLIIIAFLNTIPSMIYKEIKHGSFEFGFGTSPFLITLILGLFFMVLSEIFKIAKTAKEENELTI
ncbi:DUF2975 domain-containing protein [Pseudofulvibacter geojedonensis]|uniref:DUF2975 domain-containing protein n=1 Tax=Pseudofulvibacter geojedonensis TaxID=1123758 RepID=A0ABW3I3M1_9FLAO